MKKNEIKVGESYATKISGQIAKVTLLTENVEWGGWDAINDFTGRKVRIRSAAKLRRTWEDKFRCGECPSCLRVRASHDEKLPRIKSLNNDAVRVKAFHVMKTDLKRAHKKVVDDNPCEHPLSRPRSYVVDDRVTA